MTAIHEVNETLAYAIVDPGVTQVPVQLGTGECAGVLLHQHPVGRLRRDALVHPRHRRALGQKSERRDLADEMTAVGQVVSVLDGGVCDRRAGGAECAQQARRLSQLSAEIAAQR